MIARRALKHAIIALSFLAAAAGCARVAEEPQTTGGPKEPTHPEPALTPEPSLASEARSPDPAPLPEVPAIAESGRDASGETPSTGEAPSNSEPPSMAEAQLPRPESAPGNVEPPPVLDASAVAQAESSQPPESRSERDLDASDAVSPLDGESLDLASLQTRLRKTKAISLRTKLAVKKESEALLERFRAYHTEHGTATLAELRRSYDSLFRKLYSLLEDGDPPLARDIDRSRAEIWAILADPIRFGASTAGASTRGTPQA